MWTVLTERLAYVSAMASLLTNRHTYFHLKNVPEPALKWPFGVSGLMPNDGRTDSTGLSLLWRVIRLEDLALRANVSIASKVSSHLSHRPL